MNPLGLTGFVGAENAGWSLWRLALKSVVMSHGWVEFTFFSEETHLFSSYLCDLVLCLLRMGLQQHPLCPSLQDWVCFFLAGLIFSWNILSVFVDRLCKIITMPNNLKYVAN